MAGSGNRADRRRHTVSIAELTVALQHHRAGRLQRAEAFYRKFLQKSLGNPDALHLLGVVVLALGSPDQAIQLIGKALDVVPNFAQGHSNLGNALRAAGRLAEACASYRQAIALRPDFAAAHSNLGLVLCEQGDFAAAVASCRRAIAIDPRSAEAHANLGNALRRMGRLEAAETSLRQSAQLDPGSVGLQIHLADVLLELRRFAAAAACYRRAIELDPRLVGAHRGLATSLRSAGEVDAAIASYRDALTLSPAEAPLRNDLGRCFLALGRFEEAVEAFRRALAIDPDLADAYRNLAACRQLPADEPEMARIAALAARTDLPIEERAAAVFAVGKALDDAERYDEAFTAYDSAIRLYRVSRAGRATNSRPGIWRAKLTGRWPISSRPSLPRSPAGATHPNCRSSSSACRGRARASWSRSPPAIRASSAQASSGTSAKPPPNSARSTRLGPKPRFAAPPTRTSNG
jgi:protein O-GlcNAc transferase